MADDSLEIIQSLDNHPCNTPRGTLYYDLNTLTKEQQIILNQYKINLVRDNERYLASHPQIRAFVALISRHVFLHRPRTHLHEFVGNYMSRPKADINEEIKQYIAEREPHVYEGTSAVGIAEQFKKEEKASQQKNELKTIPRNMIEEIINKAFTQFGIDVDMLSEKSQEHEIINKMSETESKTVGSEIINKMSETEPKMVGSILETFENDTIFEEQEVVEYLDLIKDDGQEMTTSSNYLIDTEITTKET